MDRKESIEIPFGAFDSELKGWEYTIPEGMEAIIKDGKIIVREKESEDERIRQDIITTLSIGVSCEESALHPGAHTTLKEAISWLEKQGEKNKHTKHPDMVANLKEYLANTPKEQLEKDWDELKHWNNVGPTVEEFLYGERRNPAKWGERDNMILDSAIEILNSFGSTYETTLKGLRLIKSSLQPQWKPSKDQIKALEDSIQFLGCTKKVREDLKSLYEQLKKLKGE